MDNKRILVVDDDMDILLAYQAILAPEKNSIAEGHAEVAKLLQMDPPASGDERESFAVGFAKQGEEALQMVEEGLANNAPYAVAFIDIRMPPGWDGMKTAAAIRELDPAIEIVIITAYSDRSREEIVQAVGAPDKLLYLRKPFDQDELYQLALSLTSKWNLALEAQRYITELKESNETAGALLNTPSDSIFLFQTDGTLLEANDIVINEFAKKGEEIIGSNVFELFPEKVRKLRKQKVAEVVREGKPLRVEDKREGRWFDTVITPIKDEKGKVAKLIAKAREITDMKEMELKLELKAMELTEVNNALKVLLQQSTEAVAEHERKIYDNLQRLVFPYLEKLESKLTEKEEILYTNVIKANLEKITSTFSMKMSSKLSGMTPRELQVAELIKQGKSTKEMALLLGLSARTVEFYRDKLRVKLGLKKKKVNLRSHLSSMS